MLFVLSGKDGPYAREATRGAIWDAARAGGLDRVTGRGSGATEPVIDFFRAHDLGFRIRRLRFLARRLSDLSGAEDAPVEAIEQMTVATYECLALYLDREMSDFYGPSVREAAAKLVDEPQTAMDALADTRNLRAIDQMTDERIAEALAALPKTERRVMLLTYLGFPYYDIATLPLLQGEGLDEFDPVKVDRISPDDASAIREGGAEATLKGVQFNSFGAFFSRAYRENDYLWGRLHGADRLIDVIMSSLPSGKALPPGAVSTLKHAAFVAILDEEEPRLKAIPELFRDLRREIA